MRRASPERGADRRRLGRSALALAAIAATAAGCQSSEPPTAQPWVSLVDPESPGAFERCVGFLAFLGLDADPAKRGMVAPAPLDGQRIADALQHPLAAMSLSRYQGSFQRGVFPPDAPDADLFLDAEKDRCARILTSTT